MSTPDKHHSDRPNTYFVQDHSNQNEITRLLVQDHMLTASMGGVLSEQPEPASFQRVLDVACGVGGWLIDTAKAYPGIEQLIGVDISARMIEYACKQAQEQQVSDRVEFHVMDALFMLEFPAGFFDLVNMRLGMSFLRIWDWPRLLIEFERVTRPGGIIRITESDFFIRSTSPALTRLTEIALKAFHQAGNLFPGVESGAGIGELANLAQQYGLQNVQTRPYTLVYQGDTPEGKHFAEDMRYSFSTALAFYQKWTRVPDDYDALCQQAITEMQQPDFEVKWNLLTVWGSNPHRRKRTEVQSD